MSVSVTVKTIIGVKLPEAPYSNTSVRGCKHALPKATAKHCSECGAIAWEKSWEPLPIYNEVDGTIGKFSIEEGDDGEYYVGTHLLKTGDCMYGVPELSTDISSVNTFSIRDQLKKLLEPHELWTDDMVVKLWLFGDCS